MHSNVLPQPCRRESLTNTVPTHLNVTALVLLVGLTLRATSKNPNTEAPAEKRTDSNYLCHFHPVLANKENCPPRTGSWRPWGRPSGRCSWCSQAAAGLSSGSELEAVAGHLHKWTSELPPGGAVNLRQPGSASPRFSPPPPPPPPRPHISAHPPQAVQGTKMWQHAIMGIEIIAHCHICFDTGCYLAF